MRKYQKGELITSLEEMVQQDFIYHFDKVLSKGWFCSWQIHFAQGQINLKRVFKANKIVKGNLNL